MKKYDFDTAGLVARLAFANTPRSLLQSLLKDETVSSLAEYRGANELFELARRAANQPNRDVEDTAVAYAAIAALAKQEYSQTVIGCLRELVGLPLTWAAELAREVRDYAIPTVSRDLTPKQTLPETSGWMASGRR